MQKNKHIDRKKRRRNKNRHPNTSNKKNTIAEALSSAGNAMTKGFLSKALREGKTISIPSLGIEISKKRWSKTCQKKLNPKE